MTTVDLPWLPVHGTEERVLRHRDTGKLIQFTDDVPAPEQELPIVGLASMFSQEDMDRLSNKYSEYELASGGA